jgi:hypothetical protein
MLWNALLEMTTLAACKVLLRGIPRLDGVIGYSFMDGRPMALAISALPSLDRTSLIEEM